MAKITLGGKEVEVDEDGFIQEPDLWDQNVAIDLAKTEGVQEMGEDTGSWLTISETCRSWGYFGGWGFGV